MLHLAFNEDALAGGQASDGLKTCAVFVAQREVKEQIVDTQYASLCESLRQARADTFEISQRLSG